MKRILIISLRRLGDIYSVATTISALKADNNVKVDLLIYKESIPAAQNLSAVNCIYSIDRKSIVTKKNNPIFQDGMALNEFQNNIARLQKIKWSKVINISNDTVGSYLTSLLTNFDEQSSYAGLKFSESNTTTPSNDWAVVLNDILPCFKHTPFHFQDIYHKMLNISPSTSKPKLKINPQYESIARSNFQSIRQNETFANTTLKIIGIQLKTSSDLKDIPFNTITELINLILDTPDLYPVLLISTSKEEKNYARQINSYFDNRLIAIESDLCALNSVITKLDLLITPDTVTKHIADLCKTPLIEVSLGPSPFLKQGSTNDQSLIITNSLRYRFFKDDKDKPQHNHITAQDIFLATKIIFKPDLAKSAIFSPNVSLYKLKSNNGYTCYDVIAGDNSLREELSRQIARNYILTKIDNIEFSYPNISLSCYQTTKKWILDEKHAIAEISRRLLKTLRELIQLAGISNQRKDRFVAALDDLLLGCDDNMLSSIPLLFFRARLESLPKSSFIKSSSKIEALLYVLKEDLQELTSNIKTFETSLIRNHNVCKKAPQQIVPRDEL